MIDHRGYHITDAAKELGVSIQSIITFLRRKAPETLQSLLEQGKIRRAAKLPLARERITKIRDPAEIIKILQRYDGNISKAAGVMECSEMTIRNSLKRLAPDFYAQRTAPWRQKQLARHSTPPAIG